jgi:hypothetical protein
MKRPPLVFGPRLRVRWISSCPTYFEYDENHKQPMNMKVHRNGKVFERTKTWNVEVEGECEGM